MPVFTSASRSNRFDARCHCWLWWHILEGPGEGRGPPPLPNLRDYILPHRKRVAVKWCATHLLNLSSLTLPGLKIPTSLPSSCRPCSSVYQSLTPSFLSCFSRLSWLLVFCIQSHGWRDVTHASGSENTLQSHDCEQKKAKRLGYLMAMMLRRRGEGLAG